MNTLLTYIILDKMGVLTPRFFRKKTFAQSLVAYYDALSDRGFYKDNPWRLSR